MPATEEYLGYTIAGAEDPKRGAYVRYRFTVLRGDQPQGEVVMEVSYEFAAIQGGEAKELAESMGRRFVHGLLLLDRLRPGEPVPPQVRHSDYVWYPNEDGVDDRVIEFEILRALRRLLRNEAGTFTVVPLEVDGIADVLGVNPQRLGGLLNEMATKGLVEPFAETFGRSLADGACRITAAGLAALSEPAPPVPYVADEPQRSRERDEPSPQAPETQVATEDAPRPRVTISYSHDSSFHKDRVLDLAGQLRKMGIETWIDRYDPAPPQGWPRVMNDKLNWADHVVVVCTETYGRRALGLEEPGAGLGAGYEGIIINQDLYESGGWNEKYLPVLFDTSDAAHIPVFLRPYTRYDVSRTDGFNDLYRRITNQPEVIVPPLGPLVEMSADEPLPAEVRVDEIRIEPQNLPDWHLDLTVIWDEPGDRRRHALSWAPGTGFFEHPQGDTALAGTGATAAASDLPLEETIAVSYLPSKSLRLDFAAPIRPVKAQIHRGEDMYDPHERGGGAVHYFVFRLERIPGI